MYILTITFALFDRFSLNMAKLFLFIDQQVTKKGVSSTVVGTLNILKQFGDFPLIFLVSKPERAGFT